MREHLHRELGSYLFRLLCRFSPLDTQRTSFDNRLVDPIFFFTDSPISNFLIIGIEFQQIFFSFRAVFMHHHHHQFVPSHRLARTLARTRDAVAVDFCFLVDSQFVFPIGVFAIDFSTVAVADQFVRMPFSRISFRLPILVAYKTFFSPIHPI